MQNKPVITALKEFYPRILRTFQNYLSGIFATVMYFLDV